MPDWFDISNYDLFKKMTDKEILEEVRLRSSIMNDIIIEMKYGRETFYEHQFSSILKGAPALTVFLKEYYEDLDTQTQTEPGYIEYKQSKEKFLKYTLNSGHSAIQLLTTHNVWSLNESLVKLNNEFKIEDQINSYDHGMFLDASIDKLNHALETQDFLRNTVKLNVEINLWKNSDEQILSSLKELLPIWRKEFEIENIESTKPRSNDIKKIIDYQAIAFLDIFIWEFINKKIILRATLLEALYPETTRDTNFLKQVLMPFIHTIALPFYEMVD
jgi:hypothetical protein